MQEEQELSPYAVEDYTTSFQELEDSDNELNLEIERSVNTIKTTSPLTYPTQGENNTSPRRYISKTDNLPRNKATYPTLENSNYKKEPKCELCEGIGHKSICCPLIKKLRRNHNLAPDSFCLVYGGQKREDCKLNKCKGLMGAHTARCSAHDGLWWPICPANDYLCGDMKYKDFLKRQEEAHEKGEAI